MAAARGGADGQFAPAGADLQQPGAGARTGQVQQLIDLRPLRPGQPLPAGGQSVEDGRGIGECVVQEEGEEVVGQVVVVVDVGACPVVGVALADRLPQCPETAQTLQCGGDEGGDVVGEDLQHAHQVLGLPLPRHVGLAEAGEASGGDTPEEGVGGPHREHRTAEAESFVGESYGGEPFVGEGGESFVGAQVHGERQPGQGAPYEAFGHRPAGGGAGRQRGDIGPPLGVDGRGGGNRGAGHCIPSWWGCGGRG